MQVNLGTSGLDKVNPFFSPHSSPEPFLFIYIYFVYFIIGSITLIEHIQSKLFLSITKITVKPEGIDFLLR